MTREQKEAKARYIGIVMRETWGNDEQMQKHYEKTLFTAVELSNGYLIPIEKSSIKKSFCFGYSLNNHDTEDYDRANEQAEHARKSVDYFIAENLKPVDNYISSLEEMEKHRYIPVIRTHYNRAPKDTIIKCIDWVKDWEYSEYTEAQKAEKELLSGADIGGKWLEYITAEELAEFESEVKKHRERAEEFYKQAQRVAKATLKNGYIKILELPESIRADFDFYEDKERREKAIKRYIQNLHPIKFINDKKSEFFALGNFSIDLDGVLYVPHWSYWLDRPYYITTQQIIESVGE